MADRSGVMVKALGLTWAIVLVCAGCAGSSADGGGASGPWTTGTGGSGAPNGTATGAGNVAGSATGTGTAGSTGAGQPSNAGDKYTAVGTNPFVVTAHDALSTFAVDVDTASYDIFRRDANLNQLPQANSVRLEEYVNNFRYDYPAPAATDAHPFKISLAAARGMFDRETTLLRVGIQAFAPPPAAKRPANIVFLVDVSGSMASEDKLPLVKRVLQQALTILSPDDKVSIVTYSEQALVRLAPTPVANASTINTVISGLSASGSTAGAAALLLAYDQAQRAFIEGGINHIVQCTDGDFNVGPSTTDELLALVKQRRASGITLTVLGFGVGNLNDEMMEKVSNAGNGIYGVISSAMQADTYVRERLLSTIVHVAKNMKVQVELNPALVSSYRLLGYEDRAVADSDFRKDSVDGGEIGAGHRVTALYELVPAGQVLAAFEGAPAIVDGPASGRAPEVSADDLALVKVRYQGLDVPQDGPAQEVNVGLPATAVLDDLGDADPDLRFAAALGAFAEVLKRSPYADKAYLPLVEQIFKEQASRDADRAELANLFARVKPLLPAP